MSSERARRFAATPAAGIREWRRAACASLALCILLACAGCSTLSGSGDGKRTEGAGKRGGYYLDDGPGDRPLPHPDEIADAIPRWEPLHRGTARPYTVMGRSYTPMTRHAPYRERGLATWYGRRYHGRPTSSGEPYDMYAMTAAHTVLPIPSYARVTNLANQRSVIVRINDRGPFLSERLIDLSYVAAHKLDILRAGSALVEVEAILPESWSAETTPPRPLTRAPLLVRGGDSANKPAALQPPPLAREPESHTTSAETTTPRPLTRAPVLAREAESHTTSAETTPPRPLTRAPLLVRGGESANDPAAPQPPLLARGEESHTTPGETQQPKLARAESHVTPAAPQTPLVLGGKASQAAETPAYFLQLGAFAQRENAERHLERVSAQLTGLEAPLAVVGNTDQLHRVHVGPYSSREAALRAADAISQRIGIAPVLIVPR